MKVIDIPIESLREALWNPNKMDEATIAKLKESVRRFGFVENLVVRSIRDGKYEVLSGNQRSKVLGELGFTKVPCVVVELDDSLARLLAQALNRIQGEDDLGLKSELLKEVLKSLSQEEVLSILPETAVSLQDIALMGEETIAENLQAWQQAQAARLKHFQFQISSDQVDVVEEAIARVLPDAKELGGSNPNARGRALFLLCKRYLEKGGKAK